jgi:putative transposase
MRGPKPPVIVLTDTARQALEQLVRRHSTAQQVALRARLILAAAEGANNSQIAREEGVDIETVRLGRGRWLGLQALTLDDLSVEDRLMDAPRSGKPVRITDARRSARASRSPARPPNARGVPSAKGPGGRWPRRSNSAASWPRSPSATRHGS